MHSYHHSKFQPERWLPDPVRARLDVFWPILASLYTLYKQHIASLYSQHSCCGFSTATICCCGTETALVWLPHSLSVASTQTTRCGVGGTGGTGGTRESLRPRGSTSAAPPPRTHTQDRYPALRGDELMSNRELPVITQMYKDYINVKLKRQTID